MTTHHPTTPPPHLLPPPSPWQPVWEIIRFELRESLRTRFLLATFAMFFVGTLLYMHTTGTTLGASILAKLGLVPALRPGALVPYANAPLAIMKIFATTSPLWILVALGVFAERATKDFTNNVDALVFTTPLKEQQFVAGRFIASFLISFFITLSCGLALLLGSALPWMDPARIAPFNLLSYFQPYGYLVIPNLLIFGFLSFGLGLLTRRTLPSYLALVALTLAAEIIRSLFSILRFSPFWITLVSPSGIETVDYAVRFWTQVERNTLSVPFVPVIWLSRLLFLGLSAAFFLWVLRSFSFSGVATRPPSWLEKGLEWGERRLSFLTRRHQPEPAAGNPPAGVVVSGQPPTVQPHYGSQAQLRHVWRIALAELQRLIGNPLVLGILAVSVVALMGMLVYQLSMAAGSGRTSLPVTGQMVRVVDIILSLFAPLLIIFLAGDLVWRERDVKMAPLSDALPVHSWAIVAGKLFALGLVLGVALLLFMIAGLIAQALNGYTDYELGVYGVGLFTLVLLDLVLVAVLAIAIQVLVNQKFLGYAISAAVIIGFASPLFQKARLLQYGYWPVSFYSQINGYGRMLEPVRWFQLYWVAVALLLVCLTILFWVRGVDTDAKTRWRIAKQRFTRPMQMTVGLAAISALALGGWIFYNTTVLNPSASRAESIASLVAYEQAYSDLENAQPTITAIDIQGDLYPEGADPQFAVRGTLTLENQTQQPISTLLLNTSASPAHQTNAITVNGNPANTVNAYAFGLNTYEFALASPLLPGDSLAAEFDLLVTPGPGFSDKDPGPNTNDLLANGTTLDRTDLWPTVGFNHRARVKGEARQQAGLPPFDEAAEAAKLAQDWGVPGVHKVQYTDTLSTVSDQVAITAGNLQREWTEGDRRYFQYATQTPIKSIIPFFSGRYEVQRDEWNGIPIEIYYHPDHDRNLDRIMRGTKAGLDYASQNFGPYPHGVYRVFETPYTSDALAFPSIVSFGEGMFWASPINTDDPTQIDTVFRIAAHEAAHQWWGEQLTPSIQDGARILTESLADYTSYQAFVKEFPPEALGNALLYSLNQYLTNRTKSDVPLLEAQAMHLVYDKGALAMMAMQDYLGEDVVNQALAKLLQEKSIAPPYPNGQALVDALRAVTPEKYQYLLTDLFETVTLYDNRITAATVSPRADGKFDVTLTVNTAKVRSDEVGNETKATMDDEELDVGIFNAADKLIYLQKHGFRAGDTTLTVTVDELPKSAGIDPLHKLIDKAPDDNRLAVTEAAS